MKRLVIVGVSMIVFAIDRLRDGLNSLFGRKKPARIVVLYYHSVPAEKRAGFARQMDTLLRCSKPIATGALAQAARGERCTAVTFDDAYRNVMENALPELQRRNIPTTIYVVPGALGGTPNWTDYSGGTDAAMSEVIVTEKQLQTLPSELVEIGSHTLTHPMLAKLSENQARVELSQSRSLLETMTGREVRELSFPYGSFNDDVVNWCREAGYTRVFTTMPKLACTEGNEFVVGRVSVEPDDSALVFNLKLQGAYRWLPQASAMKRALFPHRQLTASPNRPTATA